MEVINCLLAELTFLFICLDHLRKNRDVKYWWFRNSKHKKHKNIPFHHIDITLMYTWHNKKCPLS